MRFFRDLMILLTLIMLGAAVIWTGNSLIGAQMALAALGLFATTLLALNLYYLIVHPLHIDDDLALQATPKTEETALSRIYPNERREAEIERRAATMKQTPEQRRRMAILRTVLGIFTLVPGVYIGLAGRHDAQDMTWLTGFIFIFLMLNALYLGMYSEKFRGKPGEPESPLARLAREMKLKRFARKRTNPQD